VSEGTGEDRSLILMRVSTQEKNPNEEGSPEEGYLINEGVKCGNT